MPFQSIEPAGFTARSPIRSERWSEVGEYPAGSRLPPERDLAKQLGVSRPSVREALIALEVEGLVEVRIGSGIYVPAGERGRLARKDTRAAAGPFELLRAAT